MKRSRIVAVMAACLLTLCGAANVRAGSWPLWERYKTHFLTAEGRIVDWSADERTTSEGEAYALFFALVSNDRVSFDSILNWTAQNLAQGDLQKNLPAWLWQRSPAGNWGIADSNSASDADLWIAYSLLQAGRLWHVPSYTTLGRSLAANVASQEVASLPGNHLFLLPGRLGFQPGPQTVFANPSYAPLQILQSLQVEFPSGPWRNIEDSVFDQVAVNVGHGFAMDWVQYHADSGFVAWAGPAQSGSPCGSYDAIRVYLWAGMLDSHSFGRERMLESLSGMKSYVSTHGIPPEHICMNGAALISDAVGMCCRRDRAPEPPVGFSAALVPFLVSVGAEDAARAQAERMNRERVDSTGLYGREERYYDQNLALFSLGWTQRLFRFDARGQLQLNWKS